MQRRLIIRQVWTWLDADKRLIEIFIAFIATHLIILSLPQSPVTANDHTAFSLWLAGLRPVLGTWRNILATLGLLTMRTSLWMRVLVAAIGLILMVRLSVLIENWRTLSARWRWRQGLIVLGLLLLVAGWGTQTLWAWTEPDLVAWPETPVAIPDRNLTVSPLQTKPRLWNGYWGLYLLPQGTSWGFEMQASDLEKKPLSLLLSVQSEPQERLRIALTAQTPEAYFALAEQNLSFHISVPQASEPDTIQFQAFNIEGELLAELPLEAEQTIQIEETRLRLTRLALPQFEAIYNPGALIQIVGGLVALVGYGLQYGGSRANQTRARESLAASSKSPDAEDLPPSEESQSDLQPVENEGEECTPSSLE